MDDTISRQAAIDALTKHLRTTDVPASYPGIITALTEWLDALPSVQPEIIHCKDCKYYKAYEYTGELACHYVIGGTVVRNLNDFCSRGEKT